MAKKQTSYNVKVKKEPYFSKQYKCNKNKKGIVAIQQKQNPIKNLIAITIKSEKKSKNVFSFIVFSFISIIKFLY